MTQTPPTQPDLDARPAGPPAPHIAEPTSSCLVPGDETPYLARDSTWLLFNERVLALAEDPSVPLFERIKFLAIGTSNLDEFFMKRVALMRRRIASGVEHRSHDGLSVRQQLAQARELVLRFQARQARVFEELLRPALANEGVRIVDYADLDGPDRDAIDQWFNRHVFPILTPLAVDPGHRFPFISNLSESLGVLLTPGAQSERLFARVKIPEPIPRLVALSPGGVVDRVTDPRDVRFVPQEQIIQNNLDDVFPGMTIVDSLSFRVTRSAGVEAEGEPAENLLESVEEEIRQRRFADPVRIETREDPSRDILELLTEELELSDEDVYARPGPLEYADFTEVLRVDRPELKQPRWRPIVPARLRVEDADIFSIIRERDVFVHHPYDSFEGSVERFIAAAAADPNVLAIKQTLYRTSRDSPFIDSLIRAADDGKAVACLVELRARFDEHRNVRFARELENHGVHVAYGVIGLKTHCKCSLVVRREGDGLRSYVHIGTGNYHPDTAQLYTDCGLLTCEPALAQDVVNIFNYLTGRSRRSEYDRLLVAPVTMRGRFEELIDREADNAKAGKPARIIAKMNSLEDTRIIDRLYAASRAGVSITLVVRGFCCLRPGIAGLSENIRVLSVVGRFLEHSRIFHFAAGSDDPADGEWYIGSADWMSRNLNDRVEVIAPVDDPEARSQLWRVLAVNLADRRRAWTLTGDGVYLPLAPEPPGPDDPAPPANDPSTLGTFETLCREALGTLHPDGE